MLMDEAMICLKERAGGKAGQRLLRNRQSRLTPIDMQEAGPA